jgi:hypothetical protein
LHYGNNRARNFSTGFCSGANLKRQSGGSSSIASILNQCSTRLGEKIRVSLDRHNGKQTGRVSRGERGEGKLKTFGYILFLGLFIYCGVKLVPPYVAEYQLSDKMQEQARYAIVNRYAEDQIRDNIFKVVQDLEVPVKKEAIKVTSTNQVVKISLEYTVPVDLLFYHIDMHFAPSSENKALF